MTFQQLVFTDLLFNMKLDCIVEKSEIQVPGTAFNSLAYSFGKESYILLPSKSAFENG